MCAAQWGCSTHKINSVSHLKFLYSLEFLGSFDFFFSNFYETWKCYFHCLICIFLYFYLKVSVCIYIIQQTYAFCILHFFLLIRTKIVILSTSVIQIMKMKIFTYIKLSLMKSMPKAVVKASLTLRIVIQVMYEFDQ